ncbi:MAG: cardiolipin synthase A [Herbiconiux sp.]|uniref:phospholipase D-like domain-containing protein n=1 Tax=Herbiconiux sp. TaxID=1871186 RepID=UPI00121CAA9A|nr:phospholipase D-like domain-containing protein [Herbiconiux sp.]TAJ48609.1 MAG: cardiolipin synthase A [Herbiconiux sp.]
MTSVEFGETLALVLVAAHVVFGFIATVLVSANRRPSAAIAWVLTIVFIPFLGALAFLLVGRSRLPARRREQQRAMNSLLLDNTSPDALPPDAALEPSWLASVTRLNTGLGALPMVGANSVRIIEGYTESFDAMIEAIDRATARVHVEFYIAVLDDSTRPFFEALARASARGVEVRVLADHLSGFLYPHRRSTQAFLADAGVQFLAMLPLRPLRGQWQRPDLRNHRKLVVVDGAVAFTGSQNLIDETYLKASNIKRGLHWVELMIGITGPAARELDAVFLTDWAAESGEVLPFLPPGADAASGAVALQTVPSGPSFDNDNNLKLFAALIHKAERRISITSPYFVPEESIQLALVTAAGRGLAIELFVSEIGDQKLVYHAQRSYYEALLRAGVRIHLYQAPAVLHSKHFTIDDDVAIIGSSNMDIRSFSLNAEVSMLVHSREFVDRMRAVEDRYRASSRELHLEDWLRRPLGEKTWDNLARLTSSLQ